jgi:hypothetical protein
MALRINRFRITTRIYTGYGILVAFCCSLAVFGGWQLSILGGQIGRLVVMSEQVSKTLDIRLQLETLRRAALQYQSFNDAAAKRDFATAYGLAGEGLKTAAHDTRSEERRKAYQGLLVSLDLFNSRFARLGQLAAAAAEANWKQLSCAAPR